MRFTLTRRLVTLALMAAFAFATTLAFAETPESIQPAAAVVENPYGMEALWAGGDFVSKGTLIVLAIMSMGSWYVAIVKLLEQSRLLTEGKEARKKFWQAASIDEGSRTLNPDSAFHFLAEEGIKAATHHGGAMTDVIDFSTWVGMSLQRAYDEISDRLQGGLAFVATVGSTAPFVGLFGTVWGIYHALTAIGISGQASIMTAVGLAVAVPAVLAYNLMVRRNKSALAQVRHFSSELHMVLLSGGKKGARAKP